ncbi:hypothetical protein U0R10_00110 [Aquirufa sp. OSTEICH-129V]|uniref:Tetratricopeptide repeat protein n=1 Tax=Aquirufa avitistagni TaxID=3104728 RepID=A0ABW6D8B4_9BACT
MKRILFILLMSIVIYHSSFAQNNLGKSDDVARIVLSTYIPDQVEGLTDIARSNLENKINQIATKQGVGGNAIDKRFIISAAVNVISKEITTTAPPMHSYAIDVNFFVGDGIAGTKFSGTNVTLKGVGETESKAYVSALRNLKTDDPKYTQMIEQGKNKIIEYYNSRCDFIIKGAQTKAKMRDFDAALAELVAIPEVCKDCYMKSMDEAATIYREKLELECQQNITNANVLIAKNDWQGAADYLVNYTPDMKCYTEVGLILKKISNHLCAENLGKARAAWANRNAEEASAYLGAISSDSECAADAATLSAQVATKLDIREKKEEERQLRVEESNKLAATRSYNLQKSQIKAIRDIGVAYGNHQPKIVYRVYRYW